MRLDGITELAKHLQLHPPTIREEIRWVERRQADTIWGDRDVLDGGGDDLRLWQPLGGEIGPLAVDLDADQLGVGVALEGCEQIALAAGAVDHREVTAGQLEQVVGNLPGALVGGRLMPCVGNVWKGTVGHDVLLCYAARCWRVTISGMRKRWS